MEPELDPKPDPDRAPVRETESALDVELQLERQLELEREQALEGAFRRQLQDELTSQGSRPMAAVVERAAARGRRRVLVRIAASAAAALAIVGVAAVVAPVDDDGPGAGRVAGPASAAAPASATVPASATGPESRPPSMADPSRDEIRTALARELGDVLPKLLPAAGVPSALITRYTPEAGISAELTWDDGRGPVGVSLTIKPIELTACRKNASPTGEGLDDHGVTHTVTCTNPGRGLDMYAAETFTARDGGFLAHGVARPLGPSTLRLIWGNGPLDWQNPGNALRKLPFSDEQGVEIAMNPRWESVARRLEETMTGMG